MSKEKQKSWLFSHQSRTEEKRRSNGPPNPKSSAPKKPIPRAARRRQVRVKWRGLCLPKQTFLSKQKNNECASAARGGPTTKVVCVLVGSRGVGRATSVRHPHGSFSAHTHSLLRLSSPVKAPLVSSIVPEISLWSRSLGRRDRRLSIQSAVGRETHA